MVFPCQLTPAEMREAYHMNLTAGFWTRTALRNVRGVLLLGGALVLLVVNLASGKAVNWPGVLGAAALGVVLIAVRWWQHGRTIDKTADAVNLQCASMTIDGSGITSVSPSGAKVFTPWMELRRWKEGALVYTIGDAKAYKVVPKRALSEMQMGELRGLLQMNIMPGVGR